MFGAILFQSQLIQDDHIPADNAQYIFFLHCRNNSGIEALGRHGGLDNMRMIPSRLFQDIKVVVYENAAFIFFFYCRFILKIPPVCIDKRQPCRLFDILFQQNKKGFEKQRRICATNWAGILPGQSSPNLISQSLNSHLRVTFRLSQVQNPHPSSLNRS